MSSDNAEPTEERPSSKAHIGDAVNSEVTDLHQSQSHSFVISKRKARERLAVTGPMCSFPPIVHTKVTNVPPLDLSRIKHDF